MKTFYSALILLLMVFCTSAQPNSSYYYTLFPGSSPGGIGYAHSPIIETCPDGGIIGTDQGITGNTFTVYRIDVNGSMVWNKQITIGFPGFIVPTEATLLADSTFAILMSNVIIPGGGFCLIKTDLSGNILWSKNYYNIPSYGWEISPYGSHGMMISRYNHIVYLNGDGTIAKSWSITGIGGIEILNVLEMGSGVTKVYGLMPNWDGFFLMDLDSNGIISNYYEYNLVGVSMTAGYINPSELLSKKGDKIYCLLTTDNTNPGSSGIFHFDEQNQIIWAKKLDDIREARNILTTVDGGCLVTGTFGISSISKAAAFKMDSTGNTVWMKFPGNLSVPEYDYAQIRSVSHDTGSGFYFGTAKPYLMIIHSDSAFTGACAYQNLTVNISDYVINSNPLTGVISPVAITDSISNITVYNTSWYRYDACTGIFIDSSTGIYELQHSLYELQLFPNPTYDHVTITIPENINNGIITVYNAIGSKVLEEMFSNQRFAELHIENMNDGVYYVELLSENKFFRGKLMKYE